MPGKMDARRLRSAKRYRTHRSHAQKRHALLSVSLLEARPTEHPAEFNLDPATSMYYCSSTRLIASKGGMHYEKENLS